MKRVILLFALILTLGVSAFAQKKADAHTNQSTCPPHTPKACIREKRN